MQIKCISFLIFLANVEVHTSATGSEASTQVEGCYYAGKSNWERVADCGATSCSASSLRTVYGLDSYHQRNSQGRCKTPKEIAPMIQTVTNVLVLIERRLATQNIISCNKTKLGRIPDLEFEVRIKSNDPIE
jgi:hypothetical protein